MQDPFKLDAMHTAVLSLDCQKGIVGRVQGADQIFGAAAQVLAAARKHKLTVIHVGLGFRPGYPEIHPEHQFFSIVKPSGLFAEGSESVAFHEKVAPIAGEVTVVKHRVSAFSGNDLEMILRAQRIRHLVLFGISTSGIVLSTLRQASDLDFQCTVIKDCCFDNDPEIHRVLTEKVFTRQAAVVDAQAFIKEML